MEFIKKQSEKLASVVKQAHSDMSDVAKKDVAALNTLGEAVLKSSSELHKAQMHVAKDDPSVFLKDTLQNLHNTQTAYVDAICAFGKDVHSRREASLKEVGVGAKAGLEKMLALQKTMSDTLFSAISAGLKSM